MICHEEGHRIWLQQSGGACARRSHQGLERGTGFGAEKGERGDTNHGQGLRWRLGAGRTGGKRQDAVPGRPGHQLGRQGALWALQDLCLQVAFFTGLLQLGLVSSQGGISRSNSVLSQQDHPARLISLLGTWKLRSDGQQDQPSQGYG